MVALLAAGVRLSGQQYAVQGRLTSSADHCDDVTAIDSYVKILINIPGAA
jgi:hypothetical protein